MLKANIQLWDAKDGHKIPLIKGTVTRAMRSNTTVTINLWYRKDKYVPIYDHRFEKIGVRDGHYNAMIQVGNGGASAVARRKTIHVATGCPSVTRPWETDLLRRILPEPPQVVREADGRR